jgi:tRNA (guanine-N7-)-methyltransferase
VTAPRPAYQFYGRRKGKPLRRQHSRLMQDLLPQVQLDLAAPLGGLSAPRWLEIGFGGGEHLAHQAALHQDVTLIGAEAFQNGVAKLLTEIATRKLTNVRIHYGDARDLLDALPASSVERLYLLYPDPWPKERQKKRRIVNAANLAHFHRILEPGGQFLFASDIPDYVDWTRSAVQETDLFMEQGDSSKPFENWTRTRFEAKAIREGRTPVYLTFHRR